MSLKQSADSYGAHMTHLNKISLAVLSTLAGVAPIVGSAEEQKEGFVEGSTLNVLSRTFYMNRDSRKGQSSPTGNGYPRLLRRGSLANLNQASPRVHSVSGSMRLPLWV